MCVRIYQLVLGYFSYETQKSVIAQLQEQLSEEKARAREAEGELKAEVEKMGKTCSEQQQVRIGYKNGHY